MEKLNKVVKERNDVLNAWRDLFVDRENKYTDKQRKIVAGLLYSGYFFTNSMPFTAQFESVGVRNDTPYEEMSCVSDLVTYRDWECKADIATLFMRRLLSTRTTYVPAEGVTVAQIVDTLERMTPKLIGRLNQGRHHHSLDSFTTLITRTRMSSLYRDNGFVPLETFDYDINEFFLDDNTIFTENAPAHCMVIPDQHKRLSFRYDVSKIGKAIRMLTGADDETVKELANSCTGGEVVIDNTYSHIHDAYESEAWGSCMHGVEAYGSYAWECYVGSPNASIAVLKDSSGTLLGRALVNTEDKQFHTIYGNYRLHAKLIKLGYEDCSTFTVGMKLNKIVEWDSYEEEHMLVAPYMDGDGVYLDHEDITHESGWLVLHDHGNLELDSTDGYYKLYDYDAGDE